ncbi:hypothetical protein [Roseateles depolymerans]|nr:hypothetical protein [Roseateles depolymerans]
MSIRIAILTVSSLICSAAVAGPVANEAFAQAALLGMQLSVKKAAQEGGASHETYACVQRLTPEVFVAAVDAVMSAALTQQQRDDADRFFSSDVGRKYLKHGLLQTYNAVGQKPPEALPSFSDVEYSALSSFASTSTGQLLITRQVMQSPAARQVYGRRISELVAECKQ